MNLSDRHKEFCMRMGPLRRNALALSVSNTVDTVTR